MNLRQVYDVKLELSGRSASEVERSSNGVYGPVFTKETKSKATVVFTSGLIYSRKNML